MKKYVILALMISGILMSGCKTAKDSAIKRQVSKGVSTTPQHNAAGRVIDYGRRKNPPSQNPGASGTKTKKHKAHPSKKVRTGQLFKTPSATFRYAILDVVFQ